MTDQLSPMETHASAPALVAETRAEQLLAHCEAVPQVIDNPADAKGATEMVKLLRTCRKAIDEKRLRLTRPLDEVKTMIMGNAKLLTDPLSQWESIVNDRLTRYQVEEKRKADEAEVAAKKEAEEAALAEAEKLESEGRREEAQDALELAADVPAPASPGAERIHSELGAGSTLQVKLQADFDNVEFDKVPREWLMIDERKVKAAIAEAMRTRKPGDDLFSIPGIPIVEVAKSRVS